MKGKWIKTDDFQFVLKKNKEVFYVITIIEVFLGDSGQQKFKGKYDEINLSSYSYESKNDLVISYGYESVEALKRIYKEDANQILAELISEEQLFISTGTLDIIGKKDIINNWLKEFSEELCIY